MVKLTQLIQGAVEKIDSKSDQIKSLSDLMNKQINIIHNQSEEIQTQSNQLRDQGNEILRLLNFLQGQFAKILARDFTKTFSKTDKINVSAAVNYLSNELSKVSTDNSFYFSLPAGKLESTTKELINAQSEEERAKILKQYLKVNFNHKD